MLVVKVVGERRGKGVQESPEWEPADPDPRQLVLMWDEDEKRRGDAETGGRKDAGTRRRGAKAKLEDPSAESSSVRGVVRDTKGARSSKDARATKDAKAGARIAKDAKAGAKDAKAKGARAAVSVPGKKTAEIGGTTKQIASARDTGSEGAKKQSGPADRRPQTADRGRGDGEARGTRGNSGGLGGTQGVSGGLRGSRGGLSDSVLSPQSSVLGTQDPGPRTQDSALSTQHSARTPAYTADQIQILEGVQHMRQRPGMYIGSTSTSGLLHLVYEAIDNVVDEFNAGHGNRMWISIEREGWVTVRDEARGIPIDPKEWGGAVLPAATWIFIKPFTGGKFEPGVYKQAGGLHGVGLTVINALSAQLEVDVWRDGQHFHQRFGEGEAGEYQLEPCDRNSHGTRIRWLPDPSIFDEDATYDAEAILSRLEATACLNRGLCIDLTYWDEETKGYLQKTLHSRHGLADYVRTLTVDGATPLLRAPISIAGTRDEVVVEVVLLPDSGYKTRMLSFANGVRTGDGGTHETGFKASLTKLVNDYALKWNLIKDRAKESLKPDVIQQGLSAVISVKLANPQFQGQTKNRLNNAPVEGIVRSVVSEGLAEWMEANQPHAREWLKKIHLAQKARNEAQMAEELARTGQKKNGELVDVALSKKFAACHGNDPSRNELFVVEGESAGGSAKQARRSEFQAILALKGKPLNVANASLQRILDNEEIRTIISVIGTGTRHLFDLEKLKFHKIILLADADVDGSHIVCLLLTLFHQEMPGLIEAGHVYLGCPPLYSVKHKGKTLWLADDEARKKFLRQHPDAASVEFKRYKGLGEMNASELRETTMDPARRVLKRVTMEDTALAARLVSDLMARENAEARRALLARQARYLAAAGNLDV